MDIFQIGKNGSGFLALIAGVVIAGAGIVDMNEISFDQAHLEHNPDSWLNESVADRLHGPTPEDVLQHRAGDFKDLETRTMRMWVRLGTGALSFGGGVSQIARR